MTMPNFLVIGSMKCGTDSLCNYLGQHPDVYMSPVREPSFFTAEGQPEVPFRGPGDRLIIESSSMWVSTLERYQALFSEVTTEKAIGEGTAWYIYFEDAPMRIRRHVPDAKLIVVLRNPVDRAYSAYTMLLRDGRESIGDFAEALAAEKERMRQNWEPIWHYVNAGFYTEQLKRYYHIFGPSQMRVIVYDDYNIRLEDVLEDLFGFLDVDDQFAPDTKTRYNVSRVPKNRALHTFAGGEYPVKTVLKALLPGSPRRALKARVMQRNLTSPTPMKREVRQELIEVFRAEVRELEQVIGRDLSHWLL
ncbi:MAG: sulfotransferase [Chloroflexota bacterium]